MQSGNRAVAQRLDHSQTAGVQIWLFSCLGCTHTSCQSWGNCIFRYVSSKWRILDAFKNSSQTVLMMFLSCACYIQGGESLPDDLVAMTREFNKWCSQHKIRCNIFFCPTGWWGVNKCNNGADHVYFDLLLVPGGTISHRSVRPSYWWSQGSFRSYASKRIRAGCCLVSFNSQSPILSMSNMVLVMVCLLAGNFS